MPTKAITPLPNVSLPAGVATVDDWQPDDPQPYRVSFGVNRPVTDFELQVPSGPNATGERWAER